MQPTVTILGSGYVGLTTAALLAASGITTYIIDPNKVRLDSIKQGKSFFFEAGLDPLVSNGIESGKLIPTNSYAEAVPKSTIIFSAVGTPDNPDGSSNLTYVFAAAEEAASYMNDGAIYVQKSTVPVGTGQKVIDMFKKSGKELHYVSNPEFLREGTAIQDSLWFDRVVAGNSNKQAVDQVLDLYRSIHKARSTLQKISGIQPPKSAKTEEYITTSLASAELIKVTANAFLSLKISFANSIAKLADKAGADVQEVMSAVGADWRIGGAFLNAGRGYGGGCFPKDVSGLIASGLEHGVALPIMEASQAVNDSMPGYILEKLQNAFKKSLKGRHVTVLGLAFKAGTSDVRRSPGIALVNTLHQAGAIVTAYDPQANGEAKEDVIDGVQIEKSLKAAVNGTEAIIIATDWPEFLQITPKDYAEYTSKGIFVDAMNRFKPDEIAATGMQYIGIGRSVN